MADQKKSPVAQERDEEARGLWRWLASRFDARRLVCLWTRAAFTPPCEAPESQGSEGKESLRQGSAEPR
jgi:hypothetical protein